MKKNNKRNPFKIRKVIIEYKETPDAEERLKKIAEMLLVKSNETCQKNASSE